MKSNAKDYSFPIDIYTLAIVAHRLCNMFVGHEEGLEELNQENFSIPARYSDKLSVMLKTWMAPNPVDRPVLAEIALDPLFSDFFTLKRYRKQGTDCKYDGFLVRENTFAGIKIS